MKVVSLFSGCGGFDLGLKQAGHDIILQCESDPGAQQVLRHAFPGVLLVPDVCALQTLPAETELVVAGFPCVDISRAGLRQGFSGKGSGLIRHVFRLLQQCALDNHAVPWVLLENVEALLDKVNGGVPPVKSITDTLEYLGYKNWAQRVVCSAGFGVPNKRRRVFVLASLHGDPRDVLLAQGLQSCFGGCQAATEGGGPEQPPCWECFTPPQMADGSPDLRQCSIAIDLGNARCNPSLELVPTFTTSNDRLLLLLQGGRSGLLRIEDAERLQGLPEGHTAPCWPVVTPGVHSHRARPLKDMDAEVRDRSRYVLIGNAVTVQVAHWLGSRLAAPYAFKYVTSERDRPLSAELQSPFYKQQEQAADAEDDLFGGLLVTQRSRYKDSASAPPTALLEKLLLPGRKGAPQPQLADDGEESDGEGDDGDDGFEGGAGPSVEAAGGKVIRYGGVGGGRPAARDSWPRAAWSIGGSGRFAVDGLSEAPVKTPFQPLGTFIQQVGRAAPQDSVHTYLQRLREQGFDVRPIVKKIEMCGDSIDTQVAGVVRLVGLPFDADHIGELVWVRDTSKAYPCWWPAEAVDPYTPPTGFNFSPEHLAALNSRERKLYVPSANGGGAPPAAARAQQQQQAPPPPPATPSAGHSSAAAAAAVGATTSAPVAEPETPDAAAGSGPSSASEDSPAPSGPSATTTSQPRKVLVVFFGDRSFQWAFKHQLLPFEEHMAAKTSEMQGLLDARLLRNGKMFERALQEAQHCLAVKRHARGVLGAADAAGDHTAVFHDAMIMSHAAAQAAVANTRPKCGKCEACVQYTSAGSTRRRCYMVRATAAAAAGHTGGQLACCGDRAVGARISVWWPLDQAWYDGAIVAYDPLGVRHTILYDDEDLEILQLWSPQCLIKVNNKPAEWEAEAKTIKARVREQKLTVQPVATLAPGPAAPGPAAAAAAAAAPAAPSMPQAHRYQASAGAGGSGGGQGQKAAHVNPAQAQAALPTIEQVRRANIERNKKALSAFMAGGTPEALAAQPAAPAGATTAAEQQQPQQQAKPAAARPKGGGKRAAGGKGSRAGGAGGGGAAAAAVPSAVAAAGEEGADDAAEPEGREQEKRSRRA